MTNDLQLNQWEIQVKTSLFNGLDTMPIKEVITIPIEYIDQINNIVLQYLNALLFQLDIVDDGTQVVELALNKILQSRIQDIFIRTALYPSSNGLCVVITIRFDHTKSYTNKQINPDKIRISNENTVCG